MLLAFDDSHKEHLSFLVDLDPEGNQTKLNMHSPTFAKRDF